MNNDNIFKRRCVACRGKFDKRDLIRIVRDQKGNFFYDKTGKADGRGGYICKNAECIEKAQIKKGLNRSFKSNIPQDIYNEIEKINLNY